MQREPTKITAPEALEICLVFEELPMPSLHPLAAGSMVPRISKTIPSQFLLTADHVS
jgi:hypothetical protein